LILAREVLVAVGGKTVLVVAVRTFLETNQTMQQGARYLWIVFLMACFCFGTSLVAQAENVCAICGKEIQGTVYIMTDQVTGEKVLVCSDCIKLPRCSICGLPVKENYIELPDGRYLCARDAKTVVLKADDIEETCSQVKDDLDRLFSRFTSFPTNVDVTVIDRIDVNSMFNTGGNSVESPDLLGCIRPGTVNDQTRYKMSLLTGMPLAQLKETCAHEYSHAWVGENVPKERHARLARDAEEGFCELVGYMLMDSQNEELGKKRVLRNHYTRGQINLFIEAEQRYGFDEVLDWMKYGVAPRLEAGHVDELRNVRIPPAKTAAGTPAVFNAINKSAPAPATIKLEGILWGNRPAAIINGRSFLVNDLEKVPLGNTNVMIRCLEIRAKSVRIQNIGSGNEQELSLPPN
jgi:hypothetical protein